MNVSGEAQTLMRKRKNDKLDSERQQQLEGEQTSGFMSRYGCDQSISAAESLIEYVERSHSNQAARVN